jgi:hypothetical protein
VRRAAWLALLALLAAGGSAGAQQFQPPRAASGETGTRLGLFGFGVRGGVDVRGGGEGLAGATLDFGDLFTHRLRLRPSGEVGFARTRSYVASLETLFRFAGDAESVIPYVGGGLSVAGHDACGADAQCPDLWFNVVAGLEFRFRSTFNWLIEYHGMDRLRNNRFYVGLTTRRGN